MIPKTDGDNFVSAMEHMQIPIRLSMTFDFVQPTTLADVAFLLQVDNFDSYQLIADFEPFYPKLRRDINLILHYKIYKNLMIDDKGEPSKKDPFGVPGVVILDEDFYFVVKNHSFEKQKYLFDESLKQMCMYYLNEQYFFNYMKIVRNRCFIGPDKFGNFAPISTFDGCLRGVYRSMIKGSDANFDEVRVTSK